jgi:hypothetical protein
MKNPYLKHEDRLAKVIAAIQVLGTYKYYKTDFARWSDRITGSEKNADEWEQIFKDHPEFFRLDSNREKASLVWRRSYPKRYDVDQEESISKVAFNALTSDEKMRVSRLPLTNEDIATLIGAATNLHNRALQRNQDKRWWIPVSLGLISLIIALLTFLFSGVLQIGS